MATKSIIPRLEGRVDQLITDHRRLADICLSLRSEREALLLERRGLQQQVKDLEHQLSVLQLCEGLGSSSTDRDQARDRARARVNRLMREVDKCITLLSAPPETPEAKWERETEGAEGEREAEEEIEAKWEREAETEEAREE